MTVQQIINLALSNTHTKSTQITSANQLLFFNLARHDVASTIRKEVNEDYFYQIWEIDAQDNTNAARANGEYIFPQATSVAAGMSKLIRLLIKPYSTDTYHIPAREVNLRDILKEHDWSWYMVNQPKSDPIYYISDESIFVAPEFKAADLPDTPAGNKQIKLYGVATIVDLAVSDVEATILIPVAHHDVIALGMEKYIYKARSKKKEAFDSMADYNAAKQDMIDDLTNRDDSFMQAGIPNDTALQYGDGVIN